jgi:Domain of unknown function (DUF4105)
MLSKTQLSKGSLLGALFFWSLVCQAALWDDPKWIRTVHYQKTLFGYNSEADDPNFFITPEGKRSPKKELENLIEAVKLDDPEEKKNASCRFPARVGWLRSQISLPESKVECKSLNAFRKRLAARSLSVVFSSYYLGNPASSFGHTFIRLGKNTLEQMEDKTSTELLDTGINYGAMTGDANPVVFAIGGLAGFFYGNYNAIPYYYKVREYNDFETRDLWSYQLDLKQEEIDFVVDHVWEMGHTLFNYFFLSENCSYHVMTILEAARPSLQLLAHLPYLYTIPSETLKALEEERIVKKVTFRPAPSTLFYHQLQQLNAQEKEEMRHLVSKNVPPQESSPEKNALIYDTALSLVDYKYAKKILKGDEAAQNIKRPLLIARSRIPVRSPDLDFSEKLKSAPHLSHGQKRLMVTAFNRDGKNYSDFEWRFAFHDLLDNSVGYPPKTKIEVMKFSARTDGHRYQLRDASLVDVYSLGSWDKYNHAASWKVRLGQWQTRSHKSDLSTQGFLAGYGYSFQYGFVSPYALLHGESSYVSEREHQLKLAYGSDVGLLFDLSNSMKFQSSLEWRAYPWNESKMLNEFRYSNREFGLGAFQTSWLSTGTQDLGLKFFKYF